MCVFFDPVESVSATHIFACLRLLDSRFAMGDGRAVAQTIVYEARISSRSRNAMVLPIPIARPGAWLEILNLSEYPDFFDIMAFLYRDKTRVPRPSPPPPPGVPFFGVAGFAPPLAVFQVGSYDVSVVPSVADFHRLDPRFGEKVRLMSGLGGRYPGFAFVVYQFAAGKTQMHPLGVSFQTRWPDLMFFPTLHVHDGGEVAETADFDHELFAEGLWLDEMIDMKLPPRVQAAVAPLLPPFFNFHARGMGRAVRRGRRRNEDLAVRVPPASPLMYPAEPQNASFSRAGDYSLGAMRFDAATNDLTFVLA
jgi:hypothetical protein